jgi:hypothetical protein
MLNQTTMHTALTLSNLPEIRLKLDQLLLILGLKILFAFALKK